VRPELEYAATFWSPHTVNDTSQIEAVQRRAARSVMNDWSRPYNQSGRSSTGKGSPTLMMQQLGWNTLQERRNQARVIMMYGIVNGLIAIPASLYLIVVINVYKRFYFLIKNAFVNVFFYFSNVFIFKKR